MGGRTERPGRSPGRCSSRPRSAAPARPSLSAPGPADIREPRSRPPRQRPQIGGDAAPRVTARPEPTPLPLLSPPSAAPRVASAAPGPLRRGRLPPSVAERRRRDPRDEGRRARARQAGSCRTGSARGRCRGRLSGQAAVRRTSARPGPAAASCSLRAPPQMSRGPEPRPSPSPEPLGVCAAGCAPRPAATLCPPPPPHSLGRPPRALLQAREGGGDGAPPPERREEFGISPK